VAVVITPTVEQQLGNCNQSKQPRLISGGQGGGDGGPRTGRLN